MNTVRLRACRGINANQTPFRVWCDLRTGAWDAAEAVNVVVDESGAVGRREGYRLVLPGDWHSLWGDGAAVAGGCTASTFPGLEISSNPSSAGVHPGADRVLSPTS